MSLVVITAFDAVVALLGSQAAERFQVIGYQQQKKPAETTIDNPLVQCWIDRAEIDWGRSPRNGPKEHEVGIKIQFTVAQPASVDIATLEDSSSTDAQRATALSNLTSPAVETTTALYAAWSAVFEILDDARNLTFGLAAGAISDKSYSNFKQDEFPPRGGPGILTATSMLEFRVKEAQIGEIGVQPDEVVNNADLIGVGTDEEEDEVSKAGVLIENS